MTSTQKTTIPQSASCHSANDARALEIMQKQQDTSDRNYLLAILYSRLGRKEDAVKSYVRSCDQDGTKIWRGRLDPEINTLIETYNLYKDEY